MDTIIGPMGFIDLGREGMLIEGFDYEQTMHANHNFPYYREHMETLGFAKDNDWVQNMVKVPDAVPEKFVKIANLISTRYGLHAKKMTKKEAACQENDKKRSNRTWSWTSSFRGLE